MWISSQGFVGWAWTRVTLISWVVWWASVHWWSEVWFDLVCHSRIDGYYSCMQSLSYFCDGGDYSYVVIWNGLYMDYNNLSCDVCGNMNEIWNGFLCPCLCGSVWSLTWCGGMCVVWIGDALLGFLKEVSYVGNPLQCDHIHHIQNT